MGRVIGEKTMSDIIDAAATLEAMERESAIRAQLQRSRTPVPYCEECDDNLVHVTPTGTRFRYCADCTFDITGVTV